MCSPGPEPRLLDGWQGSKMVPPSTQYKLSCKTIQQLESRNRQSTGWETSHPIPRHVHILHHRVLQWLRVRIEDKRPSLPFPFWSFPLPLFWLKSLPLFKVRILACAFCTTDEGENYPSESHHCSLTSPSCLSFHWSTKQGPLLTTFRNLVLVLRQGMLFRSFWICLRPFPFLFFFSSLTDGS